ncbi:MAG: hypothetical protein QXS38_02390 [Candidatus Pacearchaeota archaeon]
MRKNLLKYFLIFFFFLFFIVIKQNPAFADYEITTDHDKYPPQSTSSPDYLDPCYSETNKANCDDLPEIVNENTRTVYVTIKGLSPGEKYKYCISAKDECDIGNGNIKETREISGSGKSTDLTFPVCADGKEALKFAKKDGTGDKFDPKNDEHIKNAKSFYCSEDDYFWGQKTYKILLYSKDNNLIEEIPIYVAHYYPQVIIGGKVVTIYADQDNESPSGIKFFPSTPIAVQIKGNRRAFNAKGRNNYKIEIAKRTDPDHLLGYACVTVNKDTAGNTIDVPPEGEAISEIADINDNPLGIKLPQGSYILKINERVNEGNILHSKCNAGFSYYYIGFTVKGGEGGKIEYVSVDPHGEDLQRIEKTYDVPLIPCLNTVVASENGCSKVRTAIGDIDTTPTGFVKSVFGLVLGLAGGLALLLIIYSGYMLIESRGNPEKIEAAREQLISAIIGLLFIIFSLVAVQIIGVDILNLPGFGR